MRAPLARTLLLGAAAAMALSACQSLRKEKPAPVAAPAVAPAPQAPTHAPPPRILFLPRPAPPPKPCLPKSLGAPPRYPDTDAALRAAAGAADRYQLLAAGRILREQRLEELERAIAGCR